MIRPTEETQSIFLVKVGVTFCGCLSVGRHPVHQGPYAQTHSLVLGDRGHQSKETPGWMKVAAVHSNVIVECG